MAPPLARPSIRTSRVSSSMLNATKAASSERLFCVVLERTEYCSIQLCVSSSDAHSILYGDLLPSKPAVITPEGLTWWHRPGIFANSHSHLSQEIVIIASE